MSCFRPFEDERGIALLLVMFVVSLLIILAAEFSFTTRMEIDSALNFKEDMEGYYYALGGFQYALTEIIGKYDTTYLGSDGQIGFYRRWKEEEEGNRQSGNQDEGRIDWPPIPNRKGIRLADGAFDYIISDEQGRLNVNYLKSNAKTGKKSIRQIFRELLVATGVDEGEQADIIIDSIIDWTDRNDLHMLNGAESEWYEKNYAEKGFSEPYKCKNGRIDTIDELLLIRGITPDILYGSDSLYATGADEGRYSGIAPYITVYGRSRKINKLTAPPLLLRIIAPEKADEIMEERKDATKRKKNSTRTFRIEVKGYKLNSHVCHYIMAIVQRSRSRKTGGGAEVIFWNDDASGFGSDLGAYSESEDDVGLDVRE